MANDYCVWSLNIHGAVEQVHKYFSTLLLNLAGWPMCYLIFQFGAKNSSKFKLLMSFKIIGLEFCGNL